jgi:predicted dehydrogenase
MVEGPIRVGIAGLGRSGWNIHARNLEGLTDKFRIAAAFDPLKSRLNEAADNFGCRTYNSFKKLVEDPEVETIIVATPSNLHPKHTIEALSAGRHVICEKPMAATKAQADRMIATAEKSGKILTIFQNYRYNPDFLKVREVIASGKLGSILMIRISIHGFSLRWDWQTLKKYGGGTLRNTGPHFMDMGLQLIGGDDEQIPKVFCDLVNTPHSAGDAEDHVKVLLKLENGPLFDLEITSCCAYPQDNWLVMGTNGTLTGKSSGLKWKYFDPEAQPVPPLETKPMADRTYNRTEINFTEESWDAADYTGSGQIGFYHDFYDTVRHGKPLAITPQSVRRQIAVIEKCHKMSPV